MWTNFRLYTLLCAGFMALACILAIRTAAAEPKKDRELFSYSGSVKANSVHIVPRIPAFLGKVHAKEGDDVKRGQLLAELNGTRAKLDLDLAKAKLALAKARVLALKSELGETKQKQSPGKERIAVAEAKVSVAERELAIADHTMELLQIRAPSTGKILRSHAYEGLFVRPSISRDFGTNLFELADPIVYVVVHASEKKFADISIGQSCRIEMSFRSEKIYKGEVVYIEPGVDPETRTFQVNIKLRPPETVDRLRPGMSTRVHFLAKE